MPPLFTNIAVPVVRRSPGRGAPIKAAQHIWAGRAYGDEPLPIRLSDTAPRNARITSRKLVVDGGGCERIAYTVEIGGVELEDIGIFEVLDYVSPDHLEQYENKQFEEEHEAMRIARLAEEEEAERMRIQRRQRAKMKGVALFPSSSHESSDEELEVAVGKHGRARPTYSHLFLQPQEQRRRRRKRDPATGMLMPLSDEDDEELHRPAAPESADLPKRRRRKRDPVTGDLLPLDPLPEPIPQSARSSPHPEQSMRGEKKRPRRRRHPITRELMPLGWRYDPDIEGDSYDRRQDAAPRDRLSDVGSPSMSRLSISDAHASKRIKLRSEPSSNGMPVEEWKRNPALPTSRRSATPREPVNDIEISESDNAEDDSRSKNLLSSFKGQVSPPKTSMLNPTAKGAPSAPPTSSSIMTTKQPLTLKTLLQLSRDDSDSDTSSSAAGPAKLLALSPNGQRKTSIMNPVAAIVDETDELADESDSGGEFFVEAILGHRLSNPETHPGDPRTMQYKVKWEGYDEPTWEPFESFADPETVHVYRAHVGLTKLKATSQESSIISPSLRPAAPQESEGHEPGDDGYAVEQILAHHMSDPRSHPGRPKTMLYQVKWVGYAEPTWEPATSFDDPKMLQEYQRRVGLTIK